MKNLKSREDFLKESEVLSSNNFSLLEKSMSVKVDAKNTKNVQDSIKEIGGKITKAHDFGVIDIEVDPKLVDDIKKIEDVTDVEERVTSDKK
jgi:hypothetical protein